VAAGLVGLMSSGSGSGAEGQRTPAKAAPNPYGKKGGPAHRAKVEEVAKDVSTRGLDVDVEHHISTPGGAKGSRFVDVAGLDAAGNVAELHQVGRQTKGGAPVSREVKAMDDIQKATGIRPQFHPHNNNK